MNIPIFHWTIETLSSTKSSARFHVICWLIYIVSRNRMEARKTQLLRILVVILLQHHLQISLTLVGATSNVSKCNFNIQILTFWLFFFAFSLLFFSPPFFSLGMITWQKNVIGAHCVYGREEVWRSSSHHKVSPQISINRAWKAWL